MQGARTDSGRMIRILEADLTEQRVDAIVNAANETLLGGGGVDGAIHRAAGPDLLRACRALPEVRPGIRCPTGEARLTGGYALPARYVIHTVGPVWNGGDAGEPGLLAACYRNCLELARQKALATIAFPAISCGVFGYPPELAARIALREIDAHAWSGLEITVCCFGSRILESYRRAAGARDID
ncbi:O-acetyl-ADP-ribose deacetylase (regulator of RNase III), contains Macro domain [Dokdonella immobilis]|uniref:O-acetyl-ADP-ribose deacetylase (Regulator of RNase III), contains Macro domain n=2 Tax=Dokdonella immobilis TaxID=578942 RepID=A0A1I4YR95_9GAMM|nr:O-acetyl-ADP-ribose deacetylase (regulator of RNase III), contains Macro domain [Dokdonella immobilis]